MTIRTYTALSFKHSLEERLRASTTSGAAFVRKRQLLVFDRFLARVIAMFGDAAILKGGLVLELRLNRARTTKDVDLRMVGAPADILEKLQHAGRLALNDFMTFEVGPNKHQSEIENDGMRYDGFRFRAECKLAGKIYGSPFGVDVAFGDPILGEPDSIDADDVLAFAGIKPPVLRVYPVETHIAEKLHAYTMPRPRMNSRIKDLPDLAFLGSVRTLESTRVREALSTTFSFRGTHALPLRLPEPPPPWIEPYAAMAREDELPWASLESVTKAAQSFLDPVLADDTDSIWSPKSWTWHPREV